MQPKYFALITRPQKELSVAGELRSAGKTALVPTELKWPRKRSRRGAKAHQPKIYPLFTRYVFLGFADRPTAHDWLHVLGLDDVSGVIGFDGVPAQLSNADVWRVMQHETRSVAINSNVAEVHRVFKKGDACEIIEGPFAGHLVTIHDIANGKAKVLMGLFGSPHMTSIALDNLDAA